MSTAADVFLEGAIAEAKPAAVHFPAFKFQVSPVFAEAMISYLPPLDMYAPLSHIDARQYGNKRFCLPLHKMRKAPFWAAVERALCSIDVQYRIYKLLGISPSFAIPRVALIRDFPGYHIRIHPDAPNKLVTLQLYLASHTNAPHIGVKFYPHQFAEGHESDGVPYLPGSGYFFRRRDDSWHGVPPTQEADGVRDSLMLIYFADAKGDFV